MNERIAKIIRATGLNRRAYRTAKKEYVATPYPENLRAIRAFKANKV